MTTEEAIRKIMDRRGVRFIDLAERMNVATNTLAGRLKSKNISIDKLSGMLQVLDYKIVLVPGHKDIGRDEYEIR